MYNRRRQHFFDFFLFLQNFESRERFCRFLDAVLWLCVHTITDGICDWSFSRASPSKDVFGFSANCVFLTSPSTTSPHVPMTVIPVSNTDSTDQLCTIFVASKVIHPKKFSATVFSDKKELHSARSASLINGLCSELGLSHIRIFSLHKDLPFPE